MVLRAVHTLEWTETESLLPIESGPATGGLCIDCLVQGCRGRVQDIGSGAGSEVRRLVGEVSHDQMESSALHLVQPQLVLWIGTLTSALPTVGALGLVGAKLECAGEVGSYSCVSGSAMGFDVVGASATSRQRR